MTEPPDYTDEEWQQINSEFQRMKDDHYLDHAGAGLYSEVQIKEISENLMKNFYSNPHTSKLTEDIVDQVRFRILRHFNTSTEHYDVIFTANATAALKTVAETFNFNYHGEAMENADPKIPGTFAFTIDNHVSVLGMREIVATNHIRCLERSELLATIDRRKSSVTALFVPKNSSLLVFPAQSNFCGYKYPLELIEKVHRLGLGELDHEHWDTEWYVALDAAAIAGTSDIDLTRHKPDFMCVSFSKMFGYPTGLGCLLVSKRGEKMLKKRYFGGGTIKVALGTKNWHKKRENLHEKFEDGTISYLGIVSLLTGFNTLSRLVPPKNNFSTMSRISHHVFQLSRYFYTEASKLRHQNGRKVIKFFNSSENYSSRKKQGGICAFILKNDDGSYVGYAEFNCIAALNKIHVRTGCFCNPGACQRYLELSDESVLHNFEAGHVCGDALDIVEGRPTGAVRASFGYMTRKSDIDALLKVIREAFVNKKPSEKAIFVKNSEINGNQEIKIKLKAINLYPVKSCGAFKVEKWPLTERGLKFDREWMIVRDTGVALTQKHEPKMCLISPKITKNSLILSFPYRKSIEIPLEMSQNEDFLIKTSFCQSKVCNDNIQGVDCGEKVARWLSDCLNIDGLRLIRQDFTQKRYMKTSDKEKTKEVSLANKAQFLVINATSVKWLAKQVESWSDTNFDEKSPLDGVISRFRGNLIIETDKELIENEFSRLRTEKSQVLLENDGPCTRCQMICIDQSTGEKTSEPLRTLVRALEGKMRFGVYFSQVSQSSSERFLDINENLYAIPQ
ncbi:molybdenum cofactor sulfurase 3 [Culicoides brevitarsis]|uniref:molybdenum cofactor sulfurase 3 n=1 Tax=Culicoides brevitarsis TaxID=469753 RepID=UPI00307C0B44